MICKLEKNKRKINIGSCEILAYCDAILKLWRIKKLS